MKLQGLLAALIAPLALAASSSTAAAASSSQPSASRNGTATNTAASATTKYPVADAHQYAVWSSQLKTYASYISIPPILPSPTRSLSIALPKDVKSQVMDIPGSVLLRLINTKYRASIRSEMSAGNTPDWFKTMDPQAKSFVQNLAKEMKTSPDIIFASIAKNTATATSTGADAKKTDDEEDAALSVRAARGVALAVAAVVGVALAF